MTIATWWQEVYQCRKCKVITLKTGVKCEFCGALCTLIKETPESKDAGNPGEKQVV